MSIDAARKEAIGKTVQAACTFVRAMLERERPSED